MAKRSMVAVVSEAQTRNESAKEPSWLEQVFRDPNLDQAIATFVGSIGFLRRVGLSDADIERLCRLNLLAERERERADSRRARRRAGA